MKSKNIRTIKIAFTKYTNIWLNGWMSTAVFGSQVRVWTKRKRRVLKLKIREILYKRGKKSFFLWDPSRSEKERKKHLLILGAALSLSLHSLLSAFLCRTIPIAVDPAMVLLPLMHIARRNACSCSSSSSSSSQECFQCAKEPCKNADRCLCIRG